MEQMTGGNSPTGRWAELLRGKADGGQVHRVPDGFLKDREVTFDRQKETFRIAPLSQRQSRSSRDGKNRNGTTHPRGETE